ncbi:MIF4G-like [Trypanosoma melophagium]|uniref:MIF4G-like n=1 Tax=Trypanosoma melophagium TaxID=715481 RepID=UPI00351A9D61|nr:MIF4G-like [Trypanosoma melophagium]
MLFKPRGVTSNDPKYAGNSRIMAIADILAYRDTWSERLTEDFSLGRIIQAARQAKVKAVVPEKLVMTSNGFKVKERDNMEASERTVRSMQGALNKLTESNFDLVVRSALCPDIIFESEVLTAVVQLIYEKALLEPVFAGLYARLCHTIVQYELEVRKIPEGQRDAKSMVRVAIVERCQQMFDSAAKEVVDSLPEEEAEKLRKRNVNNIKFAGELFLKGLITQRIIDRILSEKLIGNAANDMDLEVVVNLLEVVGKLYEEKHPQAQASLWEILRKLQENRNLSMRIRFLIQNLIDRRNSGWKPRESESAVSAEARQAPPPPPAAAGQQQALSPHHNNNNTNSNHHHNNNNQYHHHHSHHQQQQQQQHNNNNNRNNDQLPPPIGRRATSYQDVSGSYGPAARRATSYSDLAGYGSYPMLPPPPPPPPPQSSSASFTPVEEQLSVDEKKLMALAQPPESLTNEVRCKITRIARDAVEEGMTNREWMRDELSKVLGPGESEKQSCMASVYVILLRALMDTKESERKLFATALSKGEWERSILCRGIAWCLTKIIADRDVSDCPNIYAHFMDVVVSIPELDMVSVARDVMARTANYLDALMVVYDCTDEWEEDFILVWDSLAATVRRPGDNLTVSAVMDAVGSLRLGSFMRNILPDFVAAMVREGIFTEEELRVWREANESNQKMRGLLEELAQLYP